ncbi:hypothetical protein [Blastopirellula retiformator]|uniref:Uncharacterized protein n=1 Tax=Blastopirellula retiformator TaxID=2527970 RepID=A0A5C5VM47_9BACT|nr:hypothetical protein [Blastopirellula retiformator]TWT39588.1 hypothetical protein Enr8_12880 [Blastopirellula retiformator]
MCAGIRTLSGEMVMLYQEIPIAPGVEAMELSWKQRVSDLKDGKQSWFDARILLEFLDDDRTKVTPTPGASTSAARSENEKTSWFSQVRHGRFNHSSPVMVAA